MQNMLCTILSRPNSNNINAGLDEQVKTINSTPKRDPIEKHMKFIACKIGPKHAINHFKSCTYPYKNNPSPIHVGILLRHSKENHYVR